MHVWPSYYHRACVQLETFFINDVHPTIDEMKNIDLGNKTRKRDKNARAKSRISTSVRNVHDPTSTPMSSDNAISGVVNDDGVSFLSDRSEMLASGDERSHEDADSSGDNIDHQQRLI